MLLAGTGSVLNSIEGEDEKSSHISSMICRCKKGHLICTQMCHNRIHLRQKGVKIKAAREEKSNEAIEVSEVSQADKGG